MSEAPQPTTPWNPTRSRDFGDYELIEEIAHGGMGMVYKARQKKLKRVVAVKMILSQYVSNPKAVQRFYTEAEAMAKLSHPNIVAIHEVGEYQKQPFFCMDYVEGQNLSELTRKGALPPREAAERVRKIAETVQYAHERGVLHRDLKPSNVLVDNKDEPRLTDFGLAKLMHDHREITLTGAILGTLSYMSPEQASGRTSEVTVQSDVYSLGAILYDLLCGEPPFRAETSMEMLRLVLEKEPVSLRLMNPKVPRDLDTICLKCLEKEPRRRYATASELAQDLGRFLRGEPIAARRVSRPEKLWRWCLREPVAASALLLFLILFVVIFIQWQQARELATKEHWQRTRAEAATVEAWREQARGLRLRGVAGQHYDGLGLLKEAAKLQGTNLTILNEIIATLALTDVRADTNWGQGAFPPGSTLLSLSGDGRYLARSDAEGRITIQACAPGGPRLDPPPPMPGASLLRLSPDGSYLAVRYQREGLLVCCLWDCKNNRSLLELTNTIGEQALDFSRDGKLFAAGDQNGSILLFRLPSLQREPDLKIDRACYQLRFDPEGRRLAVASLDSLNVFVCEIESGATKTLDHAHYVRSMAWSEDGKQLASGCADHKIYLWEVETAKSTTLGQHLGTPVLLAFAHHHPALASLGQDRILRLWDLPGRRSLVRWGEKEAQVLQFSADDHWLSCLTTETNLQMLEVTWAESCQPLPEIHTGKIMPSRLTLACRGDVLALGTQEGLHLWDLKAKTEITRAEMGELYGVASWPGQDTLITRGINGLHRFPVKRIRLREAPLFLMGPAHGYDCGWSPGEIAALPDGKSLALLQSTNVLLVDATTGQQVTTLSGISGLQTLAVSPNGEWIASGNWETEEVFVWNLRSSNAPARLKVKGRAQVTFSPDNRWLAGSTERGCHLWKVGLWTAQPPLLRKSTTQGPVPATFFPGADLVAWPALEGIVDLVDLATQKAILSLEPASKVPLAALRFSDDGTGLIAAGENGSVIIWDLSTLRAALARLNLEWTAKFLPSPKGSSPSQKPAKALIFLDAVNTARKDAGDTQRYQERLRENPNDFETWKRLGNLCMHTGEYETGISNLTQALRLKSDEKCYEWRGDMLIFLNRCAEAIGDLKNCLDLNPKNNRARERLCYVYLLGPRELRDLPEGRRHAEEGLQHRPGNGILLHRMGVVEYREGNYAKSMQYLKQAGKAYQEPAPSFLLCQAMCYAQLGQPDQARQAYDQALAGLEAKPVYVLDYEYYQGFIDEAKEVFKAKKIPIPYAE